MNGSSINYSEHMNKAHLALARCAFSKLTVTLMDEGSASTLDLVDDLEDEVVDFGAIDALKALQWRNTITEAYRSEFGTSVRLSTVALIAALPAKFAKAALARTRSF